MTGEKNRIISEINDDIEDLILDGYSKSDKKVINRLNQIEKLSGLPNGNMMTANGRLSLSEAIFYPNGSEHGLIFLTNRFDGYLMGYWSHSPWGHTEDQENRRI